MSSNVSSSAVSGEKPSPSSSAPTASAAAAAALVFGASSEQGRAVVEGLVDSRLYGGGVHACTRHAAQESAYLKDGLGAASVIPCDVQNPKDIREALLSTAAASIFFVTTTELPSAYEQTSGGFADAALAEFEVMVGFIQTLRSVHEEDKIPRHLVLSVQDNVQRVTREALEATGEMWIEPLDDGSIVPHYSAKGRGGEYALDYLKDTPGIKLTLVTLPFLYSNFLGFFAPLPNDDRTQWMLTACFGDGSHKIDMMAASDLATIVPNIFRNPEKYDRQNLRLVGQQISLDDVAAAFSDLFGKDVVYNPLTPREVAALPFATAPAMAQMCQFLGDPRSLRHDLATTQEVMSPRKPQQFVDWLLTHSDSAAFSTVGLDYDAEDIRFVTVFGATSLEGRSVVRGLLQDTRKPYRIRATTRRPLDSPQAQELRALDPNRIEVAQADFNDLESCKAAVAGGVQGAFLVTDFWHKDDQDLKLEERHVRNIIDACESSPAMRHLVFSTKESAEELPRHGLGRIASLSDSNKEGRLDAEARAVVYARAKKLSVTYVLMPCYSEVFFERIEKRLSDNGNGNGGLVLTLPVNSADTKFMCMSVDDLGPAVASIFDSYQVYAGHEIGLVTDFVTINEVRDVIEDVFMKEDTKRAKLETEVVSSDEWVEAKDTYMKDLGQMFACMSRSEAIRQRHSVAKTMKLVPSARPLRQWVEQNVDNASFREKLGLR